MSKILGQKIKKIRKQSGESQDTFAKKLGYTSRSTISKIEDGEIDMSYEKIVKLINDYALDATEMFNDETNENEVEDYGAVNQVSIPSNILKSLFKDVYFINGNAYAGKSTMVELLAKKHQGLACKENYHDKLIELIDKKNQPNLYYLKMTTDWQQFVSRKPKEYAKWIDGCSKEAEALEIAILLGLVKEGKKIFVDSNISIETLRKISDKRHVLIMLADPQVSVKRFFEREDKEKQFLYQQLLLAKDPQKAMENFRQCLGEINSQDNYDRFLHCGFKVFLRDDRRSVDETLVLAEKLLGF